MAHSASYNITDDKIRLYPAARLSPEEYSACRAAGFAFWPGRKIFAAKWSTAAEDFALSLCGEIEDDDTPDNVEARVERFAKHAESAETSAEHATEYAASDRANTARRLAGALRRATTETERAAHWRDRVAGAVRRAEQRENPGVIARRIKGLEADERKFTKELTKQGIIDAMPYECIVTIPVDGKVPLGVIHVTGVRQWTVNGTPHGEPHRSGIDEAKFNAHCEQHEQRAQRWLDHTRERLQYERALLAAVGGLPTDSKPFEVGGAAEMGNAWHEIAHVNRTTFQTVIRPYMKWDKTAVTDIMTRAEYCKYMGREYAPPVKPPTKPTVNYPGPGFHEMTAAQWSNTYRDNKGTREHADHKTREIYRGGKLLTVYLTDKKTVLPPKPPPVDPPQELAALVDLDAIPLRKISDLAEGEQPRQGELLLIA